MIYAFDIDGTLTADPVRLGAIMQALRGAGHRVIVITGCLSGALTPVEIRKAQLESYGVKHKDHYDSLYVVEGPDYDDVGRGKGRLCREESVDMMIEDTPQWAVFIRSASPNTTCLLMANK